MLVIAIMTVRTDRLADFRLFELRAAAVMARHGARIEQCVFVPDAGQSGVCKEVHCVRFPDAKAFDNYRNDPALLELAGLRASAVIHTELLSGEDGPDYHTAHSKDFS